MLPWHPPLPPPSSPSYRVHLLLLHASSLRSLRRPPQALRVSPSALSGTLAFRQEGDVVAFFAMAAETGNTTEAEVPASVRKRTRAQAGMESGSDDEG